MKYLLALLLIFSLSHAKHDIFFNDIKLGEINNIYTIKENYFKVKVTNSIARFLLGTKYVLFHNNKYKVKKSKNITFRNDSNKVIDILNEVIFNNKKNVTLKISPSKQIKITYDKGYTYKFLSNNKVKQTGTMEIKNKELISLINITQNVKIIKH